MRDPQRIPELLRLFEEAWLSTPDLRFWQVITRIHGYVTDKHRNLRDDLFYLEDDVFLADLRKYVEARNR